MNVYVYPWTTKTTADRANPYVRNVIDALSPLCRVVNRDRPSSSGLFGVLPFLPALDVLVVQWAGNIPDKRGAWAQILLLRALLRWKSALGLRVVYLLHNKVSHSSNRHAEKLRVEQMVLTQADVVITHAADGIAFAMANGVTDRARVHHVPHPCEPPFATPHTDAFERRPYDVLVWGRVEAYKGLDQFVDAMAADCGRHRVLVAGQFSDLAALEALKMRAPFITFDNRFIPEDELRALAAKTKVIVLPYRPESLLSSSTLMWSLSTDACVIGPRAGAFRDCAELGLIDVYDEVSQLPSVIERALASDAGPKGPAYGKRAVYIARNTWEDFGRTVSALIGG